MLQSNFTNQYYQPQSQQMPGGIRPNFQPLLKGRPVSSIEEARAQSIDFDGSVFFFPDLANQRIYTKQINPDGTSTLNMYQLTDIPVERPMNYITRDEFDVALDQLRNSFATAIAASQPSPPSPQAQTPPPANPQPEPKITYNNKF